MKFMKFLFKMKNKLNQKRKKIMKKKKKTKKKKKLIIIKIINIYV